MIDTPAMAVTMGDPAGIGPEIVVKLVADPVRDVPVVVLGDEGTMRRAVAAVGLEMPVTIVTDPQQAPSTPGLALMPVCAVPEDVGWGRVDRRAGRAAFDCVRHGVDLALASAVSGLVTSPINKDALRLAGLPYPGHTEILADLSGCASYAMMVLNDELRVVLVTIHESLRDAITGLTAEKELATIRLAHNTLHHAGIDRPRVAVAGLNPHAGENGLMGHEDGAVIAPAVAAAREEGVDASGPWPADTVFLRARRGEFDVVIAQYHDQGLIPVKYLGLEHGVNVTIGLPFVRTSVDHGTAFDIAGTGVADHRSLLAALRHASDLAGPP